MKKTLIATAALILLTVLYLTLWPVPIDPVVWQPPRDPGFTGVFAPNDALAELEFAPLPEGEYGPEDVALDRNGAIYTGTAGGKIVRFQADFSGREIWADTGGHPLGLAFDAENRLVVADAERGLLRIDPDKTVEVLADECEGVPIGLADEVAVARDGRIYFTDATTKFPAKDFGGPLEASVHEILEQRLNGRLLEYDPRTGRTRSLMEGISFANGLALSAREDFLLINESGRYRVLRYWLKGPQAGKNEVFIQELPGFPDNISRDDEGNFWVVLATPRNALLDAMAGSPFLRKVAYRLPKFLQPRPRHYLHVFVMDARGRVLESLQDPHTQYATNTSVLAVPGALYLGSLKENAIAVVWRKEP